MSILFAALAAALCAGAADDVRFVAGDPAALVAKIKKVSELSPEPLAVCDVEVENRGTTWAEPLVFRLDGVAGSHREHRFPRVDPPYAGRLGRPIAPGGKQTYSVILPLAKSAQATAVAVEYASFLESATPPAVPQATIAARGDGKAFDDGAKRTIHFSTITLKNDGPNPVDVTLRLKTDELKKVATLIRLRVDANATAKHEVRAIPGSNSYDVTIASAEIVDVTAVMPFDATPANESLSRALARWKGRLGDGEVARGRFRFRHEGKDKAANRAAEGRFEIGRGVLEVAADSGDAPSLDAAKEALREAFAAALRASDAELASRVKDPPAVLSNPAVVRLSKSPFDDTKDQWFGVAGDALAWIGFNELSDPSATILRSQAVDDGWLLTGMEIITQFQQAPQEAKRFGWSRLGDRWVPSSYRRDWVLENSGVHEVDQLDLDALAIGPAGKREAVAPPSGPLADALRAAWEKPYRHSATPHVIRGKFAIEISNPSFTWLERRKLSGKFTLTGFARGHWDRCEVDVDGKEWTPDQRRHFTEIFDDRLGLWRYRDPSLRPPFADAFAGAKLSGELPRIAIENGPYVAIGLDEGAFGTLGLAPGFDRQIEWATVEGRLVPKKITSGMEVLEASWVRLAPDLFFTNRLAFHEVFYKGWGTETLTFTELKAD